MTTRTTSRQLKADEVCPQCGHMAGFHGTAGSLMDSNCKFTFNQSKFDVAVTDPDTLETYSNASEAQLADVEGNFSIQDEDDWFAELERNGVSPTDEYLDLPLDNEGVKTTQGEMTWEETEEFPELEDLDNEIKNFVDSITGDDPIYINPRNPQYREYLEEHYPQFKRSDEFSDLGNDVNWRRIGEEVDWDGDGRVESDSRHYNHYDRDPYYRPTKSYDDKDED